jgi:hypothetical protein
MINILIQRDQHSITFEKDFIDDKIFETHYQLISETFALVNEDIDTIDFNNIDQLTMLNLVKLIAPLTNLRTLSVLQDEVQIGDSNDDEELPELSLEKLTTFTFSLDFGEEWEHRELSRELEEKLLKFTHHALANSHGITDVTIRYRFLDDDEDEDEDDEDEDEDEEQHDPYENLKKIICRQEKLKSLSVYDSTFFDYPFGNPRFQLKTLRLERSGFNQEQRKNLEDFLNTQNQCQLVNCEIARIFHLPSITNLSDDWTELDIPTNPPNPIVHLRKIASTMIPNPYILIYHTDFFKPNMSHAESQEMIKTIAIKYPNIEELKFTMKNVNETIPILDDLLLPLNSFKKLKKLNISHCSTLRQVARLNLPMLEKVSMKFSKN